MNMNRVFTRVLLLFLVISAAGQVSAMQVEVGANRSGKVKSNPQDTKFSRVLRAYTTPEVVVWFSGQDGLIKRSLSFYTPFFKAASKQDGGYRLFLYDLYNWNMLKNAPTSSSNFGNAVKEGAGLYPSSTRLDSGEFFTWLASRSKEEYAVLAQRFTEQSLWKKSSRYKNYGVQVKDCSWMKGLLDAYDAKKKKNDPDLASVDMAKIYSFLQYFEGIFLVSAMARNRIMQNETKEKTLVFLLPKGERDYYRLPGKKGKDFKRFESDVKEILNKNKKDCGGLKKVSIFFEEFKYNQSGIKRPYIFSNALDKRSLTVQEIKELLKPVKKG